MSEPVTLMHALTRPGKHKVDFAGIPLVIYYDEKPAIGDNGRPVRGDVTAEIEVFEQTDPNDDVVGLKEICRQHVSPHGTSGHGNAHAKAWAVEQVVNKITAYARRRGK